MKSERSAAKIEPSRTTPFRYYTPTKRPGKATKYPPSPTPFGPPNRPDRHEEKKNKWKPKKYNSRTKPTSKPTFGPTPRPPSYKSKKDATTTTKTPYVPAVYEPDPYDDEPPAKKPYGAVNKPTRRPQYAKPPTFPPKQYSSTRDPPYPTPPTPTEGKPAFRSTPAPPFDYTPTSGPAFRHSPSSTRRPPPARPKKHFTPTPAYTRSTPKPAYFSSPSEPSYEPTKRKTTPAKHFTPTPAYTRSTPRPASTFFSASPEPAYETTEDPLSFRRSPSPGFLGTTPAFHPPPSAYRKSTPKPKPRPPPPAPPRPTFSVPLLQKESYHSVIEDEDGFEVCFTLGYDG